jgi:signal transduction histidine kinase
MMKDGEKSARRVLVVDDNPAVLRLLGSLFEEEGMVVRLAKSVEEARAELRKPDATFDLVLSDIQMPKETGFDLLEWIKQQGAPLAEIPVLLTTAQLPEAENRLKGLSMGAVDYVVRPIELKELVVRAVNAIAHFRQVKGLETLLQNSESLAMTGRLLAASSHEIKNLASLVHLCSQRLERALDGTDPAERAEVLRCLSDSSALLTDVTRQVSTLLDPSTMVLSPVEVEPLIQDVIRLMIPRVRPVLLEIAPNGSKSRYVTGHPLRLKQVLINLILNGADAIQELAPEQGGRIVVAVSESDDQVTLAVTDNGIGFQTAGVRTEFEAFSTTKKLRGGQGLGLWLCSRFVQTMGGTLKLESQGVGRGATASITLKKADPPADGEGDLDISQYLMDD